MSVAIAHNKLINETNKMIKQLISSSSKEINRNNIEYVVFHKHGVCTALLDPKLTNGEILIISRFLNLVFTSNLITLVDLTDDDFGKLLTSLLTGLKIHKSHYFWVTALSIFNQKSAIEFLVQSMQMMKEIRNVVVDQNPEAVALKKSTLINISALIVKLLEYILPNSKNINISIVSVVTRIGCHLVAYLLEETGISGPEISSMTRHLHKISLIFKSKLVTPVSGIVLKEEVLIILKKLNTENILNLIPESILFINNFLPFMALHFSQNSIVQSLCKSCCSMLQRTIDPMESVQIITIAGDIVNIGSKAMDQFLHDEVNVKSLMGFIKILPSTVEHSDARNILWWHILCSLPPNIFQIRYKTYFVPFLENIIGVYLDKNNVSYGISEYNLANGYMHLSQFANHVIINLLDIIDFEEDIHIGDIGKDVLVPPFMHLARLNSQAFTPDIITSSENMNFLFNAIEIWMQIQKYQQQQQNLTNININKVEEMSRTIPKKRYKRVKRANTCFPRKLKTAKQRSREQNGNNILTLSSDDTIVTLISSTSEKQNKPQSRNNKKKSTNIVIPEISGGSRLLTCGTDNVEKASTVKSPPVSDHIFDLQNILSFFKFRTVNSPSTSKRLSSEGKAISEINPKNLPFKKRKLDAELDKSSNADIQNQTNQSVKESSQSQSEANTEPSSTDEDSNSPKNRHKYFIRSNPYGVKENTFGQNCTKSSGKSTASKSNVDFSVNVSETSKEPKCCDNRYKNNKSSSKKVEFKIKFDLNPLSKMCSDGIKLDIVKNKCKRSHTSTSRCEMIKG